MLSSCRSAGDGASLNYKNYLNLAAYVLNVIFTYGIGNAGWVDTPDNGELSRKYQTIVTPSSSAFSIWAVIFLFQAAFSVCQLLPRFRSTPMVQEGVSLWYCAVCAFQIGWTFSFAFEVIPLSLVCMLLLWASLMFLLFSQYYSESDRSMWEFWLLRFPFAIHGGWITAASALNVNVQVVASSAPADIQLAVAIVSLAVLHAISVWVLFNIARPNWTIAGVLSWAFGWIYSELGDPNALITSTFVPDIINGVRYASLAVGAFVIPAQFVFRLLLLVRPYYNPYKVAATDKDEVAAIVNKTSNQEEGDVEKALDVN